MTDPSLPAEASGVLDFWFRTLQPAQWWRVDPELDARIVAQFGSLHAAAAAGGGGGGGGALINIRRARTSGRG